MTIFTKPTLAELTNESDVEQKFIYPLLVSDLPYGFGIPSTAIQTKRNIRKFVVGKGSDQKSYFPDYLVVMGGFPIALVEAKTPGADLNEAYREARLYAHELNAIFPSGVNPLTRIIATDGTRVLIGFSDQASAAVEMAYADVDPHSAKMAEAQGLIGIDSLTREFHRLGTLVKPRRYRKARRLLGGLSVQSEEVGHNSFGATISASFAHVFNPVSRADRAHIARHGYINSKRRERYIDPIDKVIRASTPAFQVDATLIENTDAPVEVIKTFQTARQLEHQVLLIVGGVGAGKTTFIDRLQEVALPQDVRDKTVWVHINMNPAPISATEIYDWLRNEIVAGLKAAYPKTDFDDLDIMKAVYSVEVNRFKKGLGKLFASNQEKFDEKLFDILKEANDDLHNKAVSYARYCGTERQKLVVLVLDNCDKRSRDEQLLMFEAAQWLQKEFRALVVLPLREETYDNHRNEPPLDTALKDLVFRIEPPLFHHVLVSRVQLALDEISKSSPKKYSYNLPNGFKVEYAASEQAYYLTSIVRSIFEHDRQVRRMIVGLAGRNIRRALEIFLEFCTSGHISEEHILKIRRSEGDYVLPLHLVTTVLLRGNRRFYDSDQAFLKNVVDLDTRDQRPTYFARIMVLRWLFGKVSLPGPTGLKGYFPVRELSAELAVYGLEPDVVRREVEHLARAHCIVTEDFRVENISEDELIKLAPAGFVHLDMIGSASYWGAVAEDTWFDDENIARRIAGRIGSLPDHYHPGTVLQNAREVLDYLHIVQQTEAASAEAILQNSRFKELTNFEDGFAALDRMQRSITSGPWVDIQERFPAGCVATATIVNVVAFGLFAELEPGVTGLVHSSKLPRRFRLDDAYAVGEDLEVKVVSIDPFKRRIELVLPA